MQLVRVVDGQRGAGHSGGDSDLQLHGRLSAGRAHHLRERASVIAVAGGDVRQVEVEVHQADVVGPVRHHGGHRAAGGDDGGRAQHLHPAAGQVGGRGRGRRRAHLSGAQHAHGVVRVEQRVVPVVVAGRRLVDERGRLVQHVGVQLQHVSRRRSRRQLYGDTGQSGARPGDLRESAAVVRVLERDVAQVAVQVDEPGDVAVPLHLHGEAAARRDAGGRVGDGDVVAELRERRAQGGVVDGEGGVVPVHVVGLPRAVQRVVRRRRHVQVDADGVLQRQRRGDRQVELDGTRARRGDVQRRAAVVRVAARLVVQVHVQQRPRRDVGSVRHLADEEAARRNVRGRVQQRHAVGQRSSGHVHTVVAVEDGVEIIAGGAVAGAVSSAGHVSVQLVRVSDNQIGASDSGGDGDGQLHGDGACARASDLSESAAVVRVAGGDVRQVEVEVHKAGEVGPVRYHTRNSARGGDDGGRAEDLHPAAGGSRRGRASNAAGTRSALASHTRRQQGDGEEGEEHRAHCGDKKKKGVSEKIQRPIDGSAV